MKCYYYHKKGHIRRYCEELTKHLEIRKNIESQEISNSTNIVGEEFDKESDIFYVIVYENFANIWISDFGCSFHKCPYKKWFDTYKECDASTI